MKSPKKKQWMRLYELAEAIYQLAPWQEIEEFQVFGVEPLDTKETGYVSVMGMLGEHLAIAVYLGSDALTRFFALEYREPGEGDPLDFLECRQLQLSFEDRDSVEAKDREVYKELGLKYRGKQSYPIFRSTLPGYVPWFITSDEADTMISVLEQTLETVPRIVDDPGVLFDTADQSELGYRLLVRFAETINGKISWKEEFRLVSSLYDYDFEIAVPKILLEEVKLLDRQNQLTFEIGGFYLPTQINDGKNRPYFPKMVLAADRDSGMVVAFEMLEPTGSNKKDLEALPTNILKTLATANLLPGTIHVESDLYFDVMNGFTKELGVKLVKKEGLPSLDMVKNEMYQAMG